MKMKRVKNENIKKVKKIFKIVSEKTGGNEIKLCVNVGI